MSAKAYIPYNCYIKNIKCYFNERLKAETHVSSKVLLKLSLLTRFHVMFLFSLVEYVLMFYRQSLFMHLMKLFIQFNSLA